MSGKPHKGSWGDRFIIEQKPNQKRITCNFCKHYYNDGSCAVKPIVISEVGYDYWKYCSTFHLAEEYDTPQNQIKVDKVKKSKCTNVRRSANIIEDNIKSRAEKELKEELNNEESRKVKSNKGKVVKIGSTIWVYDMEECTKEVFKIVNSEDSDPDNGNISATSPVGQALLTAQEGKVCNVIVPGGMIKYKILRIL